MGKAEACDRDEAKRNRGGLRSGTEVAAMGKAEARDRDEAKRNREELL